MTFKINLKMIFKLTAFLLLSVFSLPSYAQEEILNSLVMIEAEKPVDNSYQLNLYFHDKFEGNAFIQKISSGSFQVFIPDTKAASKNIKLLYKGNINPDDVKIKINEIPYTKEGEPSRCVKLSAQTPVNSDIQLTAQVYAPDTDSRNKTGGSFMSISAILAAILLAVSAALLASICRAVKSMNSAPKNFTSFPSSFSKVNESEEQEKTNSDLESADEDKAVSEKMKPEKKMISPVSSDKFGCFDIQIQEGGAVSKNLISADDAPAPAEEIKPQPHELAPLEIAETAELISNQEKVISAAPDFGMPSNPDCSPSDTEEENRPELISELKIGADKGFYLTAAGGNSYALFGYAGDNIFFLQKFNTLNQVNLQARFYDRKYGRDVYIVSLDTYKAAVSVSDKEIRELAAI